jgi:tRNA threonylcarbamoyladenosine modification (KEOPS) complex Cgi121 subunit
VTGSVAIEILLYASGQRQIKNAIAYLGVSPESKRVAVIGIASEESPLENLRTQLPKIIEGKLDESVVEEGDNATIRRVFGITGDEMKTMLRRNTTEKEAITRLVIEKMALLSTQV